MTMNRAQDQNDPRSDELARAIAQCVDAYTRRNPASQAQFDKALAVMPGGNTRSVLFYEPFPLAIRRGEGCRLWDADGHEYLDFLAEFTAGIYGHSNPVIRAAIDKALDNGINLSGHNLLESELARLICERIPSIERLRFTNSGTEANLLAIAAAKVHTGRSKVIVFEGAYHGGLLTFVGGNAAVNVPHEFILAPYNDIESFTRMFEAHAPDVAAVLVEPMQGAGGCIPAADEFIAALRDATAAAGALLIFDEVMTSRLAAGGRQSQLGVRPDLTTVGKYIGGGMSFGAFGGRGDIMALFDPRRSGGLSHAGTFNNNVITMAAGIAGLGTLYTPQQAVILNARGDVMRTRLNTICRDRRVALQFTGLGSLMNLHATDAPIRSMADLRRSDQRIKDLFFFFMLEQGFYVARRGFIVLSLPIEDVHVERFINSFEAFVDAHARLLTTR
jgi:glutamate-1-semialdehyde 2,1-aminomutase